MNWLRRWLNNMSLRYHSKGHFDVRYFRNTLEKEAVSVGQVIEVIYNVDEIYRFKYLGNYKGRKIFKKVGEGGTV